MYAKDYLATLQIITALITRVWTLISEDDPTYGDRELEI
jgi:hypothetical protein